MHGMDGMGRAWATGAACRRYGFDPEILPELMSSERRLSETVQVLAWKEKKTGRLDSHSQWVGAKLYIHSFIQLILHYFALSSIRWTANCEVRIKRIYLTARLALLIQLIWKNPI